MTTIMVKKPYFPYNLILMVFRKVTKADKVAMIDPLFLNILAYPKPYEITEATHAHEQAHIAQVKKDGRLKFIFKYLWYSIRYGYDKNPYEVEARSAETAGESSTETDAETSTLRLKQ